MAFTTQNFVNLQGIALVMALLPIVATTNINCQGKAFHCVNSTHFMICVDLGGGLSSTIDDFIIPCPPSTECQRDNRFECEFPLITTPTPMLEQLVSTTEIPKADTTTLLTQRDYTKASESITDSYFNTVSLTTDSGKHVNTVTINTVDPRVTQIKSHLQNPSIENKTANWADITQSTIFGFDETDITTKADVSKISDSLTPERTNTTFPNIYTTIYTTVKNLLIQNSEKEEATTNLAVNTDFLLSRGTEAYSANSGIEVTDESLLISGSTIQSNSDLLSTEVLTTLPDTDGSSYMTENSLLIESSKSEATSTNVVVNTDSLISTITEAFPANGNTDVTVESFFTSESTVKSNSGLLSTEVLTILPDTDGSSYTTENSLLLQSSKMETTITNVDVNIDSLISTITETSLTNGNIDVTVESLHTSESTIKSNSGLLSTEVLKTLPDTISTITEASPANSNTDVNVESFFTSESTIQSNSGLLSTEVLTTLPDTDGSSYTTENSLLLQSSKMEVKPTNVVVNTDSLISTVTEASPANGNTDGTLESLFTSESTIKSNSGLLSTVVLTTLPDTDGSSYMTENSLLIVSSKSEATPTNVVVNTDSLISTVTEASPANGNTDVTVESLFTSESTIQSNSGLLSTEVLTTLTDTDGSSYTNENSLLLQSSKMEVIPTNVVINTDSLISTITDASPENGNTDVTVESLFTSETTIKSNSGLLSTVVLTTLPDTDGSSYMTENSLLIESSKSEATPTDVVVNTDTLISTVTEASPANGNTDVTVESLLTSESTIKSNSGLLSTEVLTTLPDTISTITEASPANSNTDVTVESLFTSESTIQSNSGLLSTEVLTTLPDTDGSSYTTENSLLLQSSKMEVIPTNVVVNTDSLISTITEASPANGNTDVTVESLFTSESTIKSNSGLLSTVVLTTLPDTDGSSYMTENSLLIESSKSEATPTNVVVNTDSLISTVTEASPANGNKDVTVECLFTSESTIQSNSGLLSTEVLTSLTDTDGSSYTTENSLLLQSSKMEVIPTNVVVNTDSLISTVTEASPANGNTDVIVESLFTSESTIQSNSGLLSTEVLTTLTDTGGSSYTTENSLLLQSSKMETTTTNVDVNTNSLISTITETSLTNGNTDVTVESLLTLESTIQSNSGLLSTEVLTTLPDTDGSSYTTENSLLLQSSKMEVIPTNLVVNTDSLISTITEASPANGNTDVTVESLFTSESTIKSNSGLLSTVVLTTLPDTDGSSYMTENSLLLQSSKMEVIPTNVVVNTDSLISTVTEASPANGNTDVTVESLFTSESTIESNSGLLSTEVLTTLPDTGGSSYTTENSLLLQSSKMEVKPTNVVVNTDSLISTVTEASPANGNTDVIVESLFTSESTIQSNSGLLSTEVLTTLPDTDGSSYTTENSLLLQSSKMETTTTNVDVNTNSLISTITETSLTNGNTDVIVESLFTSESTIQSNSGLLSTEVLTTLPDTDGSSYTTENSLLLQSFKMEVIPTNVVVNTDSLISTITEASPANGNTDVTVESLFTSESTIKSNSGLLSTVVLTTLPDTDGSSYMTENSLLIESSKSEATPTNVVVNTDSLISTITEASPANGNTDVTVESLFTSESTIKSNSGLLSTVVLTTLPDTDGSSYTTENSLLLQSSKMEVIPTNVVVNTDSLISTITEASPANGNTDVTVESLFTSESTIKSNSGLLSTVVLTTLPDTDGSSYMTENSLLIESSKSEATPTNVVVNTDSLISTVTEASPANGNTDVTVESLFTSESTNQSNSGLLSTEVLTTLTDTDGSSYTTENSLLLQSSKMEVIPTNVVVNTDSLISTVTEASPANGNTDVIVESLFTSESTIQSNSGLLSTEVLTTLTDTGGSSYTTENSLLLQSSKMEVIPTNVVVNTDSLISTITEASPANGNTDVTVESLFTSESTIKSNSGLLSTVVLTTLPDTDGSSYMTENSLLLQSSKMEVKPTNVVVNTDSLISTVTEASPANGKTDVIVESLFTSESIIQSNSGLLSTEVLTTLPDTGGSSYTTENSLLLQSSKMEVKPTNVVVNTDSLISTVTEASPANGNTDGTLESLFTSERTIKSNSGLLSTVVLTTLSDTDGSSYMIENSLLIESSKSEATPTNVVVNTNSLISTVTEASPANGNADVTVESLFTSESTIKSNSGLLSMEVLTTLPDTNGSSLTTENSLLLQSSKMEVIPTNVVVNTDSLISTITETSLTNSNTDVNVESLLTSESTIQSNSGLLSTEVLKTLPDTDGSSYTTENSLLLQSSKMEVIPTNVVVNTDSLISTVTEASPANGNTDGTLESLFTSERTIKSNSGLLSTVVLTTLSDTDGSSYMTENSLLLQSSKMEVKPTNVVVNTDSLISTVTEASPANGNTDVTVESLFTSESTIKSNSGLLSMEVLTTLPDTNGSSLTTENSLLLQSSKMEVIPTNVVVNTDSLISTITETSLTNSNTDVNVESLLTSESTIQSNSGLLSTEVLKTLPDTDGSSYTTENSLLLQSSKMEVIPTNVVVNTDSLISTVTEASPANRNTDVTLESLFTSESTIESNSGLLSTVVLTTLPDTNGSSYMTENSLLIESSKMEVIPTNVVVNTDSLISTVTEASPVNSNTDVTVESTVDSQSGKQNYSDWLQNEIGTSNSNVTISSFTTVKLSSESLTVSEKDSKGDIILQKNTLNITDITLVNSDKGKGSGTIPITNNAQRYDLGTVPDETLTILPTIDTNSSNPTSREGQNVNEVITKATTTSNTLSFTESESPSVSRILHTSINKVLENPLITDVFSRAGPAIAVEYQNKIGNKVKTTSTMSVDTQNFNEKSIFIQLNEAAQTDKSYKTEIVKLQTRPIITEQNVTAPQVLTVINNMFTTHSSNFETTVKEINPDLLSTPRGISTTAKILYNNLTKYVMRSFSEVEEAVTNQESFNASTIKILLLNEDSQISGNSKNEEKLNASRYYTPIYQNDKSKAKSFNDKIYESSHSSTDNRKKNMNESYSKQGKPTTSENFHVTVANVSKNTTISYSCRRHSRGKYPDNEDCRKFYICIGREHPIVGMCPVNTVFSESRKQCTNNISSCIRNNQFRCASEGRFSDHLQTNTYYICIKENLDTFVRFKLQCQSGYYLNRTSVRCSPIINFSSQSSSSSEDDSNTKSDKSTTSSSEYSSKSTSEDDSNTNSDRSTKSISDDSSNSTSEDDSNTKSDESTKSISDVSSKSTSEDDSNMQSGNSKPSRSVDPSKSTRTVFQCTKEGKFADSNDCRRYYKCSKSSKLGFKIKRKHCDDDKIFNQEKQKCIDNDNSDC